MKAVGGAVLLAVLLYLGVIVVWNLSGHSRTALYVSYGVAVAWFAWYAFEARRKRRMQSGRATPR